MRADFPGGGINLGPAPVTPTGSAVRMADYIRGVVGALPLPARTVGAHNGNIRNAVRVS